MRCELCRETLSARIDGEATTDEAAAIDAHLERCSECRAFADGAAALHRRVRVRAAETVPDRSATILAAVAPHAPRADTPTTRGTRRHVTDRDRTWARYALLWVALTQLVLAVPALFLGADHGADLHVAHEIGSWDAALAFAMLTVVFQPRRAAGLLPFVGALTVVLLATAGIDVAGGHTPAIGESAHLLTLAGVVLLWIVARTRTDQQPLLRGLRTRAGA